VHIRATTIGTTAPFTPVIEITTSGGAKIVYQCSDSYSTEDAAQERADEMYAELDDVLGAAIEENGFEVCND